MNLFGLVPIAGDEIIDTDLRRAIVFLLYVTGGLPSYW